EPPAWSRTGDIVTSTGQRRDVGSLCCDGFAVEVWEMNSCAVASLAAGDGGRRIDASRLVLFDPTRCAGNGEDLDPTSLRAIVSPPAEENSTDSSLLPRHIRVLHGSPRIAAIPSEFFWFRD